MCIVGELENFMLMQVVCQSYIIILCVYVTEMQLSYNSEAVELWINMTQWVIKTFFNHRLCHKASPAPPDSKMMFKYKSEKCSNLNELRKNAANYYHGKYLLKSFHDFFSSLQRCMNSEGADCLITVACIHGKKKLLKFLVI